MIEGIRGSAAAMNKRPPPPPPPRLHLSMPFGAPALKTPASVVVIPMNVEQSEKRAAKRQSMAPAPARKSVAPKRESVPPKRESVPAVRNESVAPKAAADASAKLPKRRAGAEQKTVADERATMFEDPALRKARRLCGRERFEEALGLLEQTLRENSNNVTCRKLIIRASIGLKLADRIAAQTEWLIPYFVRAEQDANACEIYARVVKSELDVLLNESTLVATALAAKRAGKTSVALDACNRLLRDFPRSRSLPAVLFAAAESQVVRGRPDLSRKTLEYIVAQYPDSVEAMRAQQQLKVTITKAAP
jgi:tetratricopeptide (TPR) repeat protein